LIESADHYRGSLFLGGTAYAVLVGLQVSLFSRTGNNLAPASVICIYFTPKITSLAMTSITGEIVVSIPISSGFGA
jgi:hypothetical protein